MRIEHRLAVHHKEIMVMPMRDRDVHPPRAIDMARHRMRGWVPIVKISNDKDGFGFPDIHKGYGFYDLLC